MSSDTPGEVECRALPNDKPVRHDLRHVYDGAQLYKSIRQYVPAELQSDTLYAAPSLEQEQNAKAIKKRRRERQKEDAETNIEDKTPSNQSDA
ncbi:unnamed protein product [Phytophthora fragariaefolia]|uniref:Unnamed protein product n=1 Tax=Phytophthora fragariaefolia TaxID=1490495 RepID=A0A9W6XK06_9STRA|nr:unnamed protein product [Phytophthora fragariaefolia]